ncbi:hypothetical protein N7G274_000863 [Stereocaulon virgatum]|uniref:Uncharacterized protein n=1 Tax=Stereocaulon virgatum TaxID=373712 RepID=A0ABR4ANP4_9LECA
MRHSTGVSTSSDPDIKPTKRTNSGSVIVFDPNSQTVTIERAESLKDQEATKTQTAPKFGNRVDIYDESRLVATLNLRKLGWVPNAKRLVGKCNQILVMEIS